MEVNQQIKINHHSSVGWSNEREDTAVVCWCTGVLVCWCAGVLVYCTPRSVAAEGHSVSKWCSRSLLLVKLNYQLYAKVCLLN